MNKIIISIDQARATGYAVSVDGEFVEDGEIEFDIKKYPDYHNVAVQVKKLLSDLVQKYPPNLVTVEDVHGGLNSGTLKKLANLQGVLVNFLIENEILFQIIPPTTWQGKKGLCFEHKVNKKIQSKAFAKELVGRNVKENQADAICMNYFAQKNIKIIVNND